MIPEVVQAIGAALVALFSAVDATFEVVVDRDFGVSAYEVSGLSSSVVALRSFYENREQTQSAA